MKKIICLCLLLALGFLCLCPTAKTKKVYADEISYDVNEAALESLFKNYFNDGDYTKNTRIYVNKNVEKEVKNYFHAQMVQLSLSTVYSQGKLVMNELNSGYKTNGSNMQHFKVVDGAENIDYTVKGYTLDEYYVSLNDFVNNSLTCQEYGKESDASLLEGWEKDSNNLYFTRNSDVLEAYRLFTAPLWVGKNKDNSNYIIYSYAAVQVVDGKLEMSLLVDNTYAGYVVEDTPTVTINDKKYYVFSRAVIASSNISTMTVDTVASAGLSGEGTAENPYLIQSAADMVYLQQEVNKGVDYAGKYFELTNDIDMNNINFVIGTGKSDDFSKTFAGHFDGKSHSIINMNISNNKETGRALFISLKAGGSIENLSVFGIVDGAQCSAGLVGWNYGAIKNCKNYADVTHNAKNCGGGIAGTCNADGTITDCYNYGTIYNNGTNQKTGGIVGVFESTAKGITGCVNYGKIIGYQYVGGISGSATADSTIQSCNNYGTVENTNTHIGGIVGYATSTSIQNCNNNGTVKGGTKRIGGIVGHCEDVITDCTNVGDVVSEKGEWVGGIVGVPFKDIKNCINNGNITGKIYVGGIAGSGKGEAVYSIELCENTGTVKATSSSAGGILGGTPTSTKATITLCTSSGNVISADKFAGAFVGKVINDCIIEEDTCVNNTSIVYIKGNDAPEE